MVAPTEMVCFLYSLLRVAFELRYAGVYFAKDGEISLTNFSKATGRCWNKSAIGVQVCIALAEIVNLPSEFQASHPYFVVQHTDWIVW